MYYPVVLFLVSFSSCIESAPLFLKGPQTKSKAPQQAPAATKQPAEEVELLDLAEFADHSQKKEEEQVADIIHELHDIADLDKFLAEFEEFVSKLEQRIGALDAALACTSASELPKPPMIPAAPSFDCEKFHRVAMAKGREQNRIAVGPFDGFVKADAEVRVASYPEDYQRLVDSNWEEVLKANPKCFDGVVYGLDKLDAQKVDDQNRLTIKLQKTSYKHQLFSHSPASDKRHLVRPEFSANAVGVSALTLASDGAILLGKRSARTPAMPGYWHLIPAGCLDRIDVMVCMEHEMLEELGLDMTSGGDVKSSVCLGIFSAGGEQNDKPELTWRVRTTKSRGQLRELFAGAKDRAEHADMAFVGPSHAEISEFMSTHKCTEVLQVLLEMHMETDVVNQP